MRVQTLLLRDFRIHDLLELAFDEHLLIVGQNGAGKTSVLEALHVVLVGRSFRRVPDEQLVRHGATLMETIAELSWAGEDHRVEFRVAPGGGKRVQMDGRALLRLAELVEATSVVTTTSEDILLVEGTPGYGRRWLDLFACQRRSGLLGVLVRYTHVLRQRNALLAAGRDDPSRLKREELEPWTLQLLELGREIEEVRQSLVQTVGSELPPAYAALAGRDTEVRLVYHPGLRPDMTIEGLRGVLRREVARGHSLWGPHRAGLEVTLEGRSAKAFASRGEKRSLAFALKVAQGRLMREPPVCLVDDLALELDGRRSAEVIRLFMGVGQVVATSTRREPAWPDELAVRELDRR